MIFEFIRNSYFLRYKFVNNVHISWNHLLERVEEYVIEFSQDGSQ